MDNINVDPATAVRIYCPVSARTLQALLAGQSQAMAGEPVLDAVLAIIRSDGGLGDFGLYKGVAEITFGFEQFTPAPGARPASGTLGALSLSPTVVVTTFVRQGATPETVAASLARLMEIHPWEVPVIEICETRLLARG
jgi:hypothetical protein